MTVAELRNALDEFPDDAWVVMSKDAEGNGFSPAYELGSGTYEADSKYSGEFTPDSNELAAVCIWPTN